MIEIDKCYLRRGKGGAVTVRKIIHIEGKYIFYKPIYGPQKKKYQFRCKKNQFLKMTWIEVDENADFSHYEGCKIHKTYGVLSTNGELIVRCSSKKADFYLRKGYAKQIDDDTLQFLDDTTENTLKKVHGDLSNPFFTAKKNTHCVICGRKGGFLSQHHIVPRRHIKKLPLEIRRCLSNSLFVCLECHRKYEIYSEKEPCGEIDDPIAFVKKWEKHFLTIMDPKHMTPGWKIFSVDPSKIILPTALQN